MFIHLMLSYSMSIVSLVVREINPTNIPLLLNYVQISDLTWEEVILDDITYFYEIVTLPLGTNRLYFSEMTIEFGAVIYGRFNEIDPYALPAGMKLDILMNLPMQGNYIYVLS